MYADSVRPTIPKPILHISVILRDINTLFLAQTAFVKDLLQRSADRYREKYELNTFRIDDFKQAVSFLSALKRIHTLLGEVAQGDVIKRKIDVWKTKMDDDEKRLEEKRPS